MVEEKKYKERALTPHAFPILKFVPRSVILLETRAELFKTRFKGPNARMVYFKVFGAELGRQLFVRVL